MRKSSTVRTNENVYGSGLFDLLSECAHFSEVDNLEADVRVLLGQEVSQGSETCFLLHNDTVLCPINEHEIDVVLLCRCNGGNVVEAQ